MPVFSFITSILMMYKLTTELGQFYTKISGRFQIIVSGITMQISNMKTGTLHN